MSAIMIQADDGAGLGNYLSWRFVIRLGLGILITGVLGGIAFSRVFAWTMRALFGGRS